MMLQTNMLHSMFQVLDKGLFPTGLVIQAQVKCHQFSPIH